MDSFYDVPRRPPLHNISERLVSATAVPEISVLCPPSNGAVVTNSYTSYGQWKMAQSRQHNKENFSHSPQNTSYLKKQVRFESPVLQQRPSLTYEPILPKNGAVLRENNANNCGQRPAFFSNKNSGDLKPPTFEQIYLANIPNRHLDLSIIDLPEQKNVQEAPKFVVNTEPLPEVQEKAAEFPQTYKDYKKLCDEIKTVDTVTDILNYKPPSITKKPEFPTDLNVNYQAEPVSNIASPSSSFETFDLVRNHTDSLKILPYNQPCNPPKYDFYNKNQPIEPKKHCHCDCTNQTAVVSQKTDSNDPTVKDLLKIITQQNEQLLLLQKQVATLISRDEGKTNTKNQIENGVQTSTQHEPQKNNRGALPKFSIDLMTSFEVSFKRQTNMYQNKEEIVMGQHQPQIQEVTETETCSSRNGAKSETNRTMVDTSLFFQEPLDIRESCPSPEPSIKINMNDYEESDDENDDEFVNSEMEASFYKNLMQQVDKILRKAQIQTNEELLGNCQNNTGAVQKSYETKNFAKDRTMNKVREATLKHLQSIGVNIENFDDSSESSSFSEENKNYNATEISFAVKQLLLKYLPDEHLAKIRHKPQKHNNEALKINRRDKPSGIIPIRPEFSFATVQYMKKYNLIATSTSNNKDTKEINLRRASRPQNSESPKILDISKLKQQPKLL